MKCTCSRCNHTWTSIKPDGSKPVVCPRCKSYTWDQPRENKEKEAGK
jgi:hypothetical protein